MNSGDARRIPRDQKFFEVLRPTTQIQSADIWHTNPIRYPEIDNLTKQVQVFQTIDCT